MPEGYRWVAREPWGTWLAFRTKPVLATPKVGGSVKSWYCNLPRLLLISGPEIPGLNLHPILIDLKA